MFVIILSVFIGSTETSAQVAARKVFFGLFREGAPHNMNYIKKFEEQTGKKPAMIMWYQDWAQTFPREDAQNVIDYGAVPQIVWEPWYWGDHNKISLKDIIDGKWDSYIATWAKEIKAFGQPIYLRVGPEFNIESYPWGVINNDKNPDIWNNKCFVLIKLGRCNEAIIAGNKAVQLKPNDPELWDTLHDAYIG